MCLYSRQFASQIQSSSPPVAFRAKKKKKNDAERIHEIKVQVLAGIGNEFLKRHREWKIPLIKVKILFSAYFFKSQVSKPSR